MIPIINDNTPSVVTELIFRLKIKDVMTRKIVSTQKNHSIREIQAIMKESSITGLPIVEGKRLIGIVSMHDLITAIEEDGLDAPAEKYMSNKLTVLEEDMPLSFAINYLNKYRFRRFPVLNMNKELVGIITSRDIINRLLVEIDKEMRELENALLKQREQPENTHFFKTFICHKFDFENAGRASTELKKYLKENSIDRKTIRQAAVASYELEINLVVHSNGGTLTTEIDNEKIVITSVDSGPGIPDTRNALKEGFSTANDWIRSLGFGAGMGLPNVNRVSDKFEINSEKDKGTFAKSIIYIKQKEE